MSELHFTSHGADDILNATREVLGRCAAAPEDATAGDIVGIRIEVQSSSGKNPHYACLTVQDFLVLGEDQALSVVDFGDLPETTQATAALLAMHLARARLHQIGELQAGMDALDEQQGTFHADLYVLPDLGILALQDFRHTIEIDPEDPEFSTSGLANVARVLHRNCGSNHSALHRRSAELRDFALLAPLVPVYSSYDEDEDAAPIPVGPPPALA